MSVINGTLVPSVKSSVDAIIASENFSSPPVIEVSPGSQKGDGFASKTYAICIKGTEKTINLFVKYLPEGSNNPMIQMLSAAFHTEFRFYDKILPAMLKFQEEKNLKVEEIFDNVPKHRPTDIKYEGVPPIILENLRSSGYTLRNFKEPIDHEHLTLALKAYAKYHALSFAMKDQKPELFQQLSSDIEDHFVTAFKVVGLGESLGSMITAFVNALDPLTDKKLLNECKNLREILIHHACTVDKHLDEYSVICQGDCWSNNTMFKYDEKTGTPVAIKLVDFQVQRYNSPVLDVSYFFYTVATREVLSNFDKYFKLYYDTLADFIKKLGSDPRKVYPRVMFLKHWKQFAKFGLTMSFGSLMQQEMNIDELPNLIDGESEKFDFTLKDTGKPGAYHDKVKEIIEHFVERDFL